MEALDFDVELLNGIPVADIRRIVITNRGGSVTIKSNEKSIREFWVRHRAWKLSIGLSTAGRPSEPDDTRAFVWRCGNA